MDQLELQTLTDEIAADCAIAAGAFELAASRFDEGSPAVYDSAGHHLTRFYNVIEQMCLHSCSSTHDASRRLCQGLRGRSSWRWPRSKSSRIRRSM